MSSEPHLHPSRIPVLECIGAENLGEKCSTPVCSVGEQEAPPGEDVGTSPSIDTLPSEILCEIMSQFLGPDGFRIATRSSSRPPGNVLLSVCRRWREVALSGPQFWSKVDVDAWKDEEFEARYDFLKLWLSRTSNSLHIVWHYSNHVEEVVTLLASKVDIWKSVDMYCDFTYGHVETLLKAASRAHLLETIDIRDLWEFSSTGEGLPIMNWPRLRHVDFNWKGYGVIKRIRAPLLQTLSIVFPCYHSEWEHIEREFQSITALILYRRGPETDLAGALIEPWCSMSSVTDLTMDIADIFLTPNLHLPQLRNLTLRGLGRFTDEEDYDVISDAIAASVKRLECIPDHDHTDDPFGHVLTLLQQFKTLEDLVLGGWRKIDVLLEQLGQVSNQTLCPKLRSVSLERCSFTCSALTRFARARAIDDSPNGIPFCGVDMEQCFEPSTWRSLPNGYLSVQGVDKFYFHDRMSQKMNKQS